MDPVTLRRTIDTWLKILDQSTYYELLGILEIADDGAIQKAFHEFSQSFHPDNHRGAPEDVRRDVTAIYRRGAEAYGVLRDPNSRTAYDLALSQGALRLHQGTGSSPAPDAAVSLESVCKTAGGRLHARQAERALSERKPDEAFALFRKASIAEGKNAELEDRFKMLFEISKTLF